MANQKPKKTAKKSSNTTKPETKKEVVETPAVQTASVSTSATSTTCATCTPSLKGFFARKCDKNENVLTIFKTPKIWGALIGELIGTMLFAMLMLTLGVQPLYFLFAMVGVYIAIVGISGANLNPLVTAGMMATRRMSAIRGVLYILAQVLGAWIGLIIVNAFRLASETTFELPIMSEISGEVFWTVALVELLGAIVIGFMFVRGLKYAKKNPLTFAMTVASGVTLAIIFGIVIAQNFFGIQNGFIYNPAAALMYQILPTTADGIGELARLAGLALAAYVVIPMIGGVIGMFIADLATKLAGCGYACEDCGEKCCEKK